MAVLGSGGTGQHGVGEPAHRYRLMGELTSMAGYSDLCTSSMVGSGRLPDVGRKHCAI